MATAGAIMAGQPLPPEDGGYFDEDDLIDEYVQYEEGFGGVDTDDAFLDTIEEEMGGGGGGGGGAGPGPGPVADTSTGTVIASAGPAEDLRGALLGEEVELYDGGGPPAAGDRGDPPPSVIEVGRNVGGGLAGSAAPVASSSSRSDLELYGFERFRGAREWRTASSKQSHGEAGGDLGGSPTMKVTKWKSRIVKSVETNDGSGEDDCDDDTNQPRDGAMSGGCRRARCSGIAAVGVAVASSGAPDAQLVRYLSSSVSSSSSVCPRFGRTSSGGSGGLPTHRSGGSGGSRYVLDSRASVPVVGRDSMAVTAGDGTRAYVHRRDEADFSWSTLLLEENSPGGGGGGGLLGVPLAELMRRANALERRAERRRRIREGRVGTVRGTEGEAEEDDDGEDRANDDGEGANDSAAQNGEGGTSTDGAGLTDKRMKRQCEEIARKRSLSSYLWVDRHAPSHFSHLLSDERTNREVLRSLREWDPYVFGRVPPPRPSAPSRPASVIPNRGGGEGVASVSLTRDRTAPVEGGTGGPASATEPKSSYRDSRPDERSRVMLLSGPPGIGKTTLAHIVARHAGYRPLEVNASDERSASALTERVVRAMESGTLNLRRKGRGGSSYAEEGRGEDVLAGRPNCLILDEIDGADAKSAVSAIVDIIKAEIPPKGAMGKSRRPYLRRPIIFICNHKHAPALRPLLSYARQFDVGPPSPHRLVARLKSVLASEKLSATAAGGWSGSGTLHRLVSGTGGDIRSCLYALQFASARARDNVERSRREEEELGIGGRQRGEGGCVDVSKALGAALGGDGRGMKDERTGVSDTVLSIFRKMRRKAQLAGAGEKKGGTSKPNKDVERILRAVECFGDNSKTLDCLFLNLLSVPYIDPTLDRCHAAHEWLSGADVYRSHKTTVATNNSTEHHSMQKFHIPSAAAAVHLLCRVETGRTDDLTFSTREMSDVRYRSEANGGLLCRFVEGLSAKARAGVRGNSVAMDVVPMCLWLLSAGCGRSSLGRAVSSVEVLSEDERDAFRHHVGVLRALGLTYVKADTDGGDGYGYANIGAMHLEPEIDRIATFERLEVVETQQRREIPSALKELLAHGANIENMRVRERAAKQLNQSESSPKMMTEGKDASAIGTARSAVTSSPIPSLVCSPTMSDKRLGDGSDGERLGKRQKTQVSAAAAKNFLGVRAAKAKAARTARRAATVGFDRSKKRVRLSNSGSCVPLDTVIRFKYQKGFTQAVRVKCNMDDLLSL